MKVTSYLYCVFATSLNIVLNALTLGRYLWLEGRVNGGRFHNWAHNYKYRPANFAQPETEQEIVDLVRASSKIRLYGSGHSFNAGVMSSEVLISLDKFTGVEVDQSTNRAVVKGGTRMRDVVSVLLDHGLAFKALPSHDAQSIGGILSTNVHGTGKDWGFVAEAVVSLTFIDGNGDRHVCGPSDDLFRAAIGGIGSIGIISEVTIQAVPKFNVEQIFELKPVGEVENDLDQLLDDNDHLSLYLFPFAEKCQVSRWNRSLDNKSFLGPLREFLAISFDAIVAAGAGNLMAYSGLLPRLSNGAHSIKKGTDLVMESNKAFNRTIYHLHQELEFTVPYEDTWPVCKRFLQLYETMYSNEMPYALLEVRFTPNGLDHAMLGAGRDQRSTWIDLICNDSRGFEAYYAAAEEVIKEIGARPHLGKYCEKLDNDHLSNVYGTSFDEFLRLRLMHDPNEKFGNSFTSRLFGP